MERQDTVAHVRVAGSLAKWAASLNVQSSKRGAAKRAGSSAGHPHSVHISASSAHERARALGFASLAEFVGE